MRCVLQRVRSASVRVGDEVIAAIGPGLLVLAGIERGDGEPEVRGAAKKIAELRIFGDADGRMNLDVRETSGAILAVSQFTLAGSIERGRRPSFTGAGDPVRARELFDQFCDLLALEGIPMERGRFGASMVVALENDGPVTFVLDVRPESTRGGGRVKSEE